MVVNILGRRRRKTSRLAELTPKQAGASSCIGDIGSHAENLAHYITGLEMEEICADMTTFVEGRPVKKTMVIY